LSTTPSCAGFHPHQFGVNLFHFLLTRSRQHRGVAFSLGEGSTRVQCQGGESRHNMRVGASDARSDRCDCHAKCISWLINGSPFVWARRPDFVLARCLLSGPSDVRRFAAVELDIAQDSLR
jgi:hypothetical protein